MLDLLLPAGIEGLALAAWHTTLVAALTTVVLFVYTLGLRAATVVHRRRQEDVERRWSDVLARAATGEQRLLPPRIGRNEHTIVLELWNSFRALVDGTAAASLIELGRFAGIERIAVHRLSSRRLTARLLGAQTLGFLGSNSRWGDMEGFLDDENAALSITCALALARIDPDRALAPLMARLPARRDWPKTNVSQMLSILGTERISAPFTDLVRHGDDDHPAGDDDHDVHQRDHDDDHHHNQHHDDHHHEHDHHHDGAGSTATADHQRRRQPEPGLRRRVGDDRGTDHRDGRPGRRIDRWRLPAAVGQRRQLEPDVQRPARTGLGDGDRSRVRRRHDRQRVVHPRGADVLSCSDRPTGCESGIFPMP